MVLYPVNPVKEINLDKNLRSSASKNIFSVSLVAASGFRLSVVQSHFRAKPVFFAASATAWATAVTTFLSKMLGMI